MTTGDTLAMAEGVCARRGQRFTPLRREVLAVIAAAERPLGAYDIIALMRGDRRQVAPPTIYRTLEFLAAQGLVHRVHSRNAYVVCRHADGDHSAELLVCKACGRVLEVPCTTLGAHVVDHAAAHGFTADAVAVEVHGTCRTCATDGPPGGLE
ncbi:MAG: transcriptional repressor [Pseudomonadota bacterium]